MAYTRDIYRRVQDELLRRRDTALSEAQARREEVHRRNGELKVLDAALSHTAMHLFEAATSGANAKARMEEVRRENEALLAARVELLADMGLPADYTEVHYTCPACSDTGYVLTSMCACQRKLLQLESLRAGGVANTETQTFESFDLDYYNDTPAIRHRMEQNLAAAKEYCEDFTPAKGNLLLMGGTGLGKTHLSTAIALRVIEQGYPVIYETVQAVLADFEYDRFRNSYSTEEGRAEKYLEVPLLILDDLGTEFSSQFTVSCLYQLVNTRLVRGLATVISTNLTGQELQERYDARLTSRFLGEYRVLQFLGTDVRLQKR